MQPWSNSHHEEGGEEIMKCKISRPTQERKQHSATFCELLLYKQGTVMQKNLLFAHNISGTPSLIRQAGKCILLTTALSENNSRCTLPISQEGHQTHAHGHTCTHVPICDVPRAL
jgi:hypothetical protein